MAALSVLEDRDVLELLEVAAEHRAQLAQQAAQLHGRLAKLTEVAGAGDADAEGEHSAEAHLEMSAKELRSMHEEVETSRLYSEDQRERVLAVRVGHVLLAVDRDRQLANRARRGREAAELRHEP